MISPASALSDVRTIVLAVGFVSYLVFHKYEPYTPRPVICLLLAVPTALSVFSFYVCNELLAIPATFVSYWLSILLFTLVYRISPFHPLAKYPGPFINRISKFVMVRIVSQGQAHLYYYQLHQKYGDIVRVGPNELSYCNVDGVSSTLSSQGLLIKGPYYDNRGPIASLLHITHPAPHAKRRRMWMKAFTGAALKDYEQITIRRMRELIEALQKRQSEIVDIARWMEYFAFDFMGDLAFNFAFEMMKEGSDVHGYWETLSGSLELSAIAAQVPWSAMVVRQTLNPGNKGHSLAELSRKMIEHRSKAPAMIKDLYYYINNEDGEGAEKPHPRQPIADAGTAIVAGSDTTSIVLTSLWYYFLRNPAYFDRLREEVNAAFPSNEEPIDQQRLSEMPFLNACLNESMRLQPPVPSGSQRTVPKGGKMVGQHFIPEGTQIFVHTYTLHRDPRYFWPYPNDFWPDRWLEPGARKSLSDPTKPLGADVTVILNNEAFIPFSVGPRNCVGKNLAWSEMRVVASYFVQRFDMNVALWYDLDLWEKTLQDWFVLRKGGLPVNLTERC